MASMSRASSASTVQWDAPTTERFEKAASSTSDVNVWKFTQRHNEDVCYYVERRVVLLTTQRFGSWGWRPANLSGDLTLTLTPSLSLTRWSPKSHSNLPKLSSRASSLLCSEQAGRVSRVGALLVVGLVCRKPPPCVRGGLKLRHQIKIKGK